MKITVGDFEVLKEGTVIGLYEHPIQFHIEDLLYELLFVDNNETEDHNIRAEQIKDKKGIRLIFTNFNNGLGIGNIKPMPLGSIRDKELFLNFRIYALKGETGKTVHYTWMTKKKKEVLNG